MTDTAAKCEVKGCEWRSNLRVCKACYDQRHPSGGSAREIGKTLAKIIMAPGPQILTKTKAKGKQRAPGEMNRTEAAYASQLDLLLKAGQIVWYKFEGIKLRLADNTFYTPDFAVLLPDGTFEFHETKALRKQKDGKMKPHFEDDARVKLKIVAELYPFTFIATWLNETKTGWDKEEI